MDWDITNPKHRQFLEKEIRYICPTGPNGIVWGYDFTYEVQDESPLWDWGCSISIMKVDDEYHVFFAIPIPATRWEPPDVDIIDVEHFRSLPAAIGKGCDMLWEQAKENALMGLLALDMIDDINNPY